MKILLVGNYLIDRQQSMQRFASVLEEGLKEAGHEVRLIRPEAYFGKLKPGSSGLGKWLGYIDKYLIFPFLLKRAVKWTDIVHICDHSNAMYVRNVKFRPHLVTCHDMIAIRSALGELPEYQVKWTGRILQRWVINGLEHARYIASVSAATQLDLQRIGRILPSRTKVIYNGLNYLYSRMDREQALKRLELLGIDSNHSFMLHVGSALPRKNRLGVLKIFYSLIRLAQLTDTYLIFAGASIDSDLNELIRLYGLSSRVISLTNVDNEDIRALYSLATALVFPSLHEGFGWPIIEAQACGCPVFTSNRAPMTEIGGDAAVYIDPEQAEDASRIIAEHWGELDAISCRGLENANQFTTSTMINNYLHCYAGLLHG